ncbi:hypothetical protein OIV83_000012 [Microbotryomycetes sp. JL201]|nr:hypothetical protein OIV83_000012 [Microbotryomycetes sp. JL201]
MASCELVMLDGEPTYEIRQTKAGFLGAFSTRRIRKGQLVLREKPLLTVDAPLQSYLFQRLQSGASGPTPVEGDSDEDEEAPTLEHFLDKNITRQLKFKTPEQQQEYWDLANTRPELPRAYGIFATNAVSTVDETGGMFLTLSRFNSACRPCLTRPQYDAQSKTFSLFAVRDIEQGQELTWPYLGVPFEFDSIESRREELERCFHFSCLCDACQDWLSDPAKMKESNRRLLQLRRLKESLSSDKGGRHHTLSNMIKLARDEKLYEMADRLQEQLDQEPE